MDAPCPSPHPSPLSTWEREKEEVHRSVTIRETKALRV